MKFKNLIRQDMLRSRSTRSEQVNTEERYGFIKQSRWANLPTELILEVLMRVEASESAWPNRKTVIACAGVCTTWRAILKHLVQTPELSGTITFPIAVKQRNRSTQTYILYLNLTSALTDDGKFLLAARKCRRPTCTDYIISLHSDEISKGSSTYVGKLRSNFLRSKFIIFDGQPPYPGAKLAKCRSTRLFNLKQVSPRVPAGNYPVGHISYELNVLGSRGPRRMNCIMDAISASSIEPGGVAPTHTELSLSKVDFFPSLPFFRSRSSRVEAYPSGPLASNEDGTLVLRNKSPRWHEQLQCWCLNFQGRVTVASVKNFQLVASTENGIARPHHEKVILQFGKVGKDIFTMDYRYPISAFQAFAICLSSFDSKIACE